METPEMNLDIPYDEFKLKVFLYLSGFKEGDEVDIQEVAKSIGYPLINKGRHILLLMVLRDIAKTGFISVPTVPENREAIEGKVTWTITQSNKQRI